VAPVTPLLADAVVRAALALPGEAIARGDRRKVALRRAARSFVPAAVAEREKKAVQYGSLVARELDRLARQAGFKRRVGDHVSKYVAHRTSSAD
jgi:asparagine synthase (glutamine-hydrolysing)